MNNKHIIQGTVPFKSHKNSLLSYENKNSLGSLASQEALNHNKEKASFNVLGTSLKNTGYISSTNVWHNSVYSFNQNYIKNLPSVDNIVNKMIKSFFTINALDNNIDSKKSKLRQRRYKRLSLNRILVSKPEIKHSNNKVSITVYLFNKKKKGLLLRLNNLYNSLSLGLAKGRSWKKINNFEKLVHNFIEPKQINSKGNITLGAKTVSYIKTSSFLGLISKGIDSRKIFKKLRLNKYAYMTTGLSLRSRKTKSLGHLNALKRIKVQNKSNVKSTFINKILYYKRLNNLTKYNVYKFINYIGLNIGIASRAKQAIKNHNSISLGIIESSPYNKLLKEFFVYTNKYKLYSKITYSGISIPSSIFNGLSLSSNIGLALEQGSSSVLKNNYLKNTNYSISKLKSIYKLFALYNNINLETPNREGKGFTSLFSGAETNSSVTNLPLGLKNNFKACLTNKIILNTYKLLKISNDKQLIIKHQGTPKGTVPFTQLFGLSSKLGNGALSRKKISDTGKTNLPSIILAKKLSRIDRFLSKYKNTLNLVTSNIALEASSKHLNISQRLASNYKINFINDILEKELLYVHYLKLLSYNNSVFKNWFLFSLKNLIAKLYNKKVVFNLINLKYIHLNSDILSQAVNIRLRNFRRNKLVDVLKKAVKLVFISKVNIYACDEHSSMYKYIHNYYDKFKHLKLDIFKELGYLETNKPKSNLEGNPLEASPKTKGTALYIPCTIRRLNHIQTSTINFIKFKSVFGVRLEAAGRLTKRSTASRAVFKFRYKGTLKNNPTINNSLSSTMIKNHQISNLQFTKISSKTRNGSFGLKGWINSN